MNTVTTWVGLLAVTALLLWWCVLVASWLLAPLLWRLSPPGGACTNGFAVHIPEYWRRVLTPAEIEAVIEHERGHIALWHSVTNLVLGLLLWPISQARLRQQEYEADDYAAARGHAMAMASSLLKLSWDPFDVDRARRLVARHAPAYQPPGDAWAFRPSEPSADLALPGEPNEALPEVSFHEPQDDRQEFPGAMRGLWPHRAKHQREDQGRRALG